MKTIRFTASFQDFINWFFNGDFQDGFTFKNFKSSVEMFENDEDINCIDFGTTWDKIGNKNRILYCIYGQLRAMYETGYPVVFKVHSGEKGDRIKYILVFNGHVVQFISWNKYPAFTWAKAVSQKPVLYLESKPRLFRRAITEIKDAIAEGYYSDSEGNIKPKDFCGEYEVRVDWMQYESGCSPQYLLMHAECGAGDICDQAISEALNWFRTGFEQGILSDACEDYIAVIDFDR